MLLAANLKSEISRLRSRRTQGPLAIERCRAFWYDFLMNQARAASRWPRPLALAVTTAALAVSLPAAAQTPPPADAPQPPPAAAPPGYAPPPPGYAPPPAYGQLPPPGYAPPPGYGPPPGAYYGPPPVYYGPPPYVPRATERQSVGAMVAGIVLTSIGGVLLIGAATGASLEATCDVGFQSCTDNFTGVAVGLVIGGVVGLAAGIPLLIYGARRVPISATSGPPQARALPAWVGAPGGTGWAWRF
jgi:hypothetical protein